MLPNAISFFNILLLDLHHSENWGEYLFLWSSVSLFLVNKIIPASLLKYCEATGANTIISFLPKILFINVLIRREAFEYNISAADFHESSFWYNSNWAEWVSHSFQCIPGWSWDTGVDQKKH